jgi:hypothetical protein
MIYFSSGVNFWHIGLCIERLQGMEMDLLGGFIDRDDRGVFATTGRQTAKVQSYYYHKIRLFLL